mgnify:CR=1 FL=1
MTTGQPEFDYTSRRRKIYNRIAESEVDAYYTDELLNLRYLFGFRGTAGSLLLTDQSTHVFLDGRYRLYGEELSDEDLSVHHISSDRIDALGQVLRDRQLNRVHFERDRLRYRVFRKIVKKTDLKNRNYGEDWISQERSKKDAEEIKCMEQAIERTLGLFDLLHTWIEPGLTEEELARILRAELESRGEAQAFCPLVLFGERTALPHAPSGQRIMEEGDPVLVDMGVKIAGYCSDLTRMFFCGEGREELVKLYDLSKQASARAFKQLEPGKSVQEVANVAKKFLSEQGHADHLRHGLGHGVGLNVHEEPRLSVKSGETLEPGMVVTLEPGIYIDGVGGGRIEHMALVTEEGARILDEPNSYMND